MYQPIIERRAMVLNAGTGVLVSLGKVPAGEIWELLSYSFTNGESEIIVAGLRIVQGGYDYWAFYNSALAASAVAAGSLTTLMGEGEELWAYICGTAATDTIPVRVTAKRRYLETGRIQDAP